MEIVPRKLNKKPLCRVELHVHLDGAIRHETIWELCRRKEIPLPGDGSLSALKEELRVNEPIDLTNFLQKFSIFMSAFVGDLKSLERIGYEFVEDQFHQSVAYCEARFCPHLLLPKPEKSNSLSLDENKETVQNITVRDILNSVLKGIYRGEELYRTKVRLVLCCLRGLPEWSMEILELCEEYRDKGIVGIDIAGNEFKEEGKGKESDESNVKEKHIFELAKEKGIGRTVHASEDGPAVITEQALDFLHAQRIGHGYRVLEDEQIYQRCLRDDVHFEVCPHSSYLTGTMRQLKLESKRHPILRFSEDGASFSINTDDPTLTMTKLDDEYSLLRRWGFTEAHFTKANFEAAYRSFLPPDEKNLLLEQLKDAYGIIDPSQKKDIPDSSVPPLVSKPNINIGVWSDRS